MTPSGKVLDLFSGIGGFALAAHSQGFETVAFCDSDQACRELLKKRFPGKPVADDVYNLSYRDGVLYDKGKAIYRGAIQIVTGGFPCQPFSYAGKRKGAIDDRFLWGEMYRLIREIKPAWVIGENVPGIVNMALSDVCADLEAAGYAVQAFNIGAVSKNAYHRRERIWIIGAHTNDSGNDSQEPGDQRKGQACEQMRAEQSQFEFE